MQTKPASLRRCRCDFIIIHNCRRRRSSVLAIVVKEEGSCKKFYILLLKKTIFFLSQKKKWYKKIVQDSSYFIVLLFFIFISTTHAKEITFSFQIFAYCLSLSSLSLTHSLLLFLILSVSGFQKWKRFLNLNLVSICFVCYEFLKLI